MDEEPGCHPSLDMGEQGVTIDARVIAQGLGMDPAVVLFRIREGAITTICERGIDADEGRHRLTFFHGSRLLRLVVDQQCNIVRRSIVDFGGQTIPPSAKKALL